MSEMWGLPGGVTLWNVHPSTACKGRGCPIHHPSEHKMRDWPLHWRSDRRLMERICVHGVGHPDPDDRAFRRRMFPSEADFQADAVHGCCGCCAGGNDE